MAPVGCVRFASWLTFLLAVLQLNSCYGQNFYDIRLVGGSQANEGRVEIYYSSQWITICDSYWSVEEAQVVCRQLGYGTSNVVARSNAYYGQGSGLTRKLRCVGYESRVQYCTLSYTYCDHSDDAGVECGDYSTTYNPFQWLTTIDYYGYTQIRLVDGYTSREGTVEILYNGEWNTICDDHFGLEEAQVVCRQLGYDTDNVTPRSSAYYGEGSGPIRQVQCYGWEYTLDSCIVTRPDVECNHNEDAGVECGYSTIPTYSPPQSPRVIGIMSFVGVSLFLLTIIAMVAVLYTCMKRQKPTPVTVELQPMSTASTTPAPAPDSSMTAPLQVNLPA